MGGKIGETAEAILGFVLGIISLYLGLGLIANSCNFIFPTSPNSLGCQYSSSNLLAFVGLVLAPIGALAVIASVVVLIRRKQI